MIEVLINIIDKITTRLNNKRYKISILNLPSQGYFYPSDLIIEVNDIYKNNEISEIDEENKKLYKESISNNNPFIIINTIKYILMDRINVRSKLKKDFNFNNIIAVDLFYIFVEYIKYSTKKDVIINDVKFSPETFIYFNFDKFSDNYNKENKEFIFNGWKFSLPTIGIETSLNKFSYDSMMKKEYQNLTTDNYNLIYFLGGKTNLNYNEMVNLIEIYQDLEESDKIEIRSIIDKFKESGVYILENKEKKTSITPSMLVNIWE